MKDIDIKILMTKTGELLAELENVENVNFYNLPYNHCDGYLEQPLVIFFKDAEMGKTYLFNISKQRWEFYR